MLTGFLRAFRTPDLRRKLLFTVFIIGIFRLGAALPTPGISERNVYFCTGLAARSGSSVYQLVNLFSGGALLKLSVFALGIMPYITASIILQLLAVVIPRLETLRKEGQAGQAKITQYTRYLTVGLAVLQSTGIVALARSGKLFQGVNCTRSLLVNDSIFTITTMVIVMTAGTAVIMWLGELITDRGVGNGMSLLIFTTVIAVIPGELLTIYRTRHAFTFAVVFLVGLPSSGFGSSWEQGNGRPPDVRRELDLHPAQGEPGRCHPGDLRLVFALYPAADGVPVREPEPAAGVVHVRADLPRARGLTALHAELLPAHRLLHVLLRGDHVQPDRGRRQHEEVRRIHPRHPPGPAHGRVPQLRAHPADRPGLGVPGDHRADPDDRTRAGRGDPELPVRRDKHPDRGGGGPRHGEANREPTPAAQLRGLPSVVRVVLVGPPGAGKGTQAQFLASHLSIPKISTGDIFRDNVSHGTALGRRAQAYMERGDLVPDEVTIAMVTDRLADDDTQAGFLLDGFPRNVPQAETLKKMLLSWDTKLDVVLELVVDDDEVVRRLSGRRTCRRCGRIWHTSFDPPTVPGTCDDCGGELFQRDDDREATIRHRLEVYQEQTSPLISFYADEGTLLGLDATGPVDEITERALSALRRFMH